LLELYGNCVLTYELTRLCDQHDCGAL